MNPATARMQWKGRKLLCNGVCVADIGKYHDTAYYGSANSFYLSRVSEASVRRAVNRKFKLPPGFGVKP
jgi:hypothetical protein